MTTNPPLDRTGPDGRLDRRRFLRNTVAVAGLYSVGTSRARGETVGATIEGAGTRDDPYELSESEDLTALEAAPEAHFELVDDIDATDLSERDTVPVESFEGTLEGQGHEIRALTVEHPDGEKIGLFGHLEGTVRNLALVDVTIEGGQQTGALAGYAVAATIESVTVSGTVSGTDDVGGVVGSLDAYTGEPAGSTVTDCAADCRVRAEEGSAGGLVGEAYGSLAARVDVIDCEASGSVTGESAVGGLIGGMKSAFDKEGVVVENCRASASIHTTDDPWAHFGGLVGAIDDGLIASCRATGSLSCESASEVGGLVGEIRDPHATVEQSAATGTVRGDLLVGGLSGHIVYGTVRQCFATGDVTGTERVGGIGGEAREATVVDSYARGAVTGERAVGGVLGRHDKVFGHPCIVERTLATGPLEGKKSVGGVVGKLDGPDVEASYWDAEVAGVDEDSSLPDHFGRSTDALRGLSAVDALEEFDFQNVWLAVPGEYPTLQAFATDDGGETTASIDRLRLCQTVEHTRAFDRENEDGAIRSSAGESLPAAESLVGSIDDPELAWSAEPPDLVAGRQTVPMFDCRVEDPDAVVRPVDVTARLLCDGEAILEATETVGPAAVAGTDPDRRESLTGVGVDPPDQLPLVEILAGATEDARGALPTLPAGPDCEYEVTVDGPNLSESVTASVSIDGQPVTTPTLQVGVVAVEGRKTIFEDFEFDQEPRMDLYAERLGQFLLQTYPVTTVDIVVFEGPVVETGIASEYDLASTVEDGLFGGNADYDRGTTIRHTVDGTRRRVDEPHSLDAGIAALPPDFFEGERAGSVPVANKTPLSDVALVEFDRPLVAAHELGHYFLGGDAYAESGVPDEDGGAHAGGSIASTGLEIQGETFAVHPGRDSLMASGGSDLWPDAHLTQQLIDTGFDAETTSLAGGVVGEIGDTISSLAFAGDGLQRIDAVSETDHVEIGTAIETIADAADRLETTRSTVDYRFQVPEFSEDLAANLEAAGEALQRVGRDLVDGPPAKVPAPWGEATTTATAAGQWAEHLGERLRDDASDRRMDTIDWMLRVDGHVDDGLPVDAEVIPVFDRPAAVDTEGSLIARGAGGGEIARGGATASLESVGTTGRESIDGAIHGTVHVPAGTTTVELRVTADGNEHHTTVDPTVDPIRSRLEGLSDTAVNDSETLDAADTALDRASDQIAEGDREAAVETLRSARDDLERAIDANAESGSGEADPEAVLARLDGQIDRVRGVGASDGWGLLPWLIGGGVIGSGLLTGGVVTGGLLYWYREAIFGNGESDTSE
ncbi:MAG: ZmpA/ZmpB/ZmpC family metallo-endopeptidase-related protein [Halococcoides sp.]